MKIFLDTADLEEIKENINFIDGVTTNPSLIKKASIKYKIKDIKKYIQEILKVTKKLPVSLEVAGGSEKEMYKQAKSLWKFKNKSNNVVIKIPICPEIENDKIRMDGLRVIQRLSKERIPVNTTLIFTPEQALLAAKAGAKYVSPFMGRIDDKLRSDNKIKFNKDDYFPSEGLTKKGSILNDDGIVSGTDLVAHIIHIFKNYNFKTEVLAASLRNPRQVREVSLLGCDVATLNSSIIKKMLFHDKTVEGMKKFTEDLVPEYKKIL